MREDARGDDDKIAGGLAAGGVVGERGDGLGEDSAVEGGVGVGRVVVDDLVLRAGVELADDGLSESHLGAVGLRIGGEDRDGHRADVRRDMSGRSGGVVAAAGY